MDTTLIYAVIISFVLSFIFSLGGVGSAIAMIPSLGALGLPFQIIKPIALLVNTLSMSGASINNIRNKRLDLKMALPIIIVSVLCAPLGAYSSQFISREILIILFTAFLIYAAIKLIRPKKNIDINQNDKNLVSTAYLLFVGFIAGTLAGILGIGGGTIVSPLLLTKGLAPKKVAALSAFVIPFSSFSGFLTYLSMGAVPLNYLIYCSGAGFIGGTIGTSIMHKHINPKVIKKFLGVLLLLMAVKMILSL